MKIVKRREEPTKHFRSEDGTYLIAQYGYPVHKLDSNSKRQDINNTLSTVNGKCATPGVRVNFAEKTTDNETQFSLHNGNKKIIMSMSGTNKKVEGQGTNSHTDFREEVTKLPKMMTLYRVFPQFCILKY